MATKSPQKALSGRKKPPKNKRVTIEIVTQMLTLATSGFGLVAALAWNSVVQNFVSNYIAKWLPSGSGIISLLIYALVVTTLAVFVTFQLSKLKERLENR
jgi:TRAP-type C4-dicarboxylate transport system permease small subunit